jgi:hypothetical protein
VNATGPANGYARVPIGAPTGTARILALMLNGPPVPPLNVCPSPSNVDNNKRRREVTQASKTWFSYLDTLEKVCWFKPSCALLYSPYIIRYRHRQCL